MPNPDPRTTPPARERAAGQARSRARRARPGPPGFTIEVQLLGGEAGRRLAQEQAEAIGAVLAWLAAHPPTPPSAAGSAAAAVGTPVAHSAATPTRTQPVRPSPAAATGASTQTRQAGAGVGRPPSRTLQACLAGEVAWRVAGPRASGEDRGTRVPRSDPQPTVTVVCIQGWMRHS